MCRMHHRKNALQPQFEQQVQLPQLKLHFSLPELLLAAYVGASWLQSNPCPSRFLDLSLVDDVFYKGNGKFAYFCIYIMLLIITQTLLYSFDLYVAVFVYLLSINLSVCLFMHKTILKI